ncbi:hypothetical protein GOODEAATRI_002678 [Goodea atripinnis]|uniref:Genetic suppressor element-like domain-containing protein n=1 Tax=Goodea atripinnis TaxID=208336 RepID=A0ABV0NR66_9TELE
MISTATRTTATVSPLTPSPLNGSIVANGSPAAQSAHSGFAAALRKLAKQAEEPRGPVLVPPVGHSVPNTPPVVTIAPTKTSNGLWRSEGRQGAQRLIYWVQELPTPPAHCLYCLILICPADSGPRGASRERLGAEGSFSQEKGGPSVPAHLLGNPYAFGLTPGAVMQDSRMDDPFCLSALRSPFYPLPTGGALPPIHPSAPHHHVSGLISNHGLYMGSGAVGTGLSASMITQRANEEERWLARQRRLRQEKEDRQSQVSEFRQQVLEQHLDLSRPADAPDHRTDSHRSMQNHHEPGSREHHPHLGAPPPLISPKPPQPSREHHPPPPTTLWNPASLIETASESRRNHEPSGMGHYELSRGPSGPSKYEDGMRRRDMAAMEKYPPIRAPLVIPEHSTFLADLEKSTQSFLSQQRASMSLPSQYEMEGSLKINAGLKNLQGHPVHSRHGQGLGMIAGSGIGPVTAQGMGPDTLLIYDEFLQQHRRPVSKLDLEEKKRREAREKGYYYELDDSYDESDEEELSTRFTPEEMDRAPELEDKKRFLTMFKLSHITVEERKAFTQPSSESEDHHNVRQHSPPSHCPASPSGHLKPLGDTLRPKPPLSPAVYRGTGEGSISKRNSSLLNSLRPPLSLQAKEGPHSVNGRTKPWDSFTPEEFAQQFHESVLQSTQKALQKHKGNKIPVQK